MDYAPAVSNRGQYLAYVSHQSGRGEIWIRELITGIEHQLTQFGDDQKYFDLMWSPGDQKIAALMIHGIKIVDAVSGNDYLIDIPRQEIRGVTWVSERVLSFSLVADGQWRVFHFNLGTKKLIQQPGQWAYEYHDPLTEQTLLIDEHNQLFLNNQPVMLAIDNLIDFRRRFNFQFHRGDIFYIRPIAKRPTGNADSPQQFQLVKRDPLSNQESQLLALDDSPQFFVASEGIYTARIAESSADIFQVVFSNP